MITSSTSSLDIYSDALTVAEISAVLGLDPSGGGNAGERIHADTPRDHRFRRTTWIFSLDGDDDLPDDGTGVTSLRALLDHLGGIGDRLALLRDRGCETLIAWGGFSDSSQGGFVIPADLLASLAATGCALHGTAYLDENDPTSD